MKKALVIGYCNENILHDYTVRYLFYKNCKYEWKCDIAQVNGNNEDMWGVVTCPLTVTHAIQYSCDNSYDLILYPYSGIWGWREDLRRAYEEYNIFTVSAHGSNQNEELESPYYSLKYTLFVGTKNDTSYGNVDVFVDEKSESNATGVVGGLISNCYNNCENWQTCKNKLT